MAEHLHIHRPLAAAPKNITVQASKSFPPTAAVLQRRALHEKILQKKEADRAEQLGRAKAAREAGENAGGLPQNIQAKMEGAFGADFSSVNIHQNSSQATELGALAYTQGEDIHFAPGQFDAQSHQGQSLIGHELAHVVQQRAGRVQATTQLKGVGVNDDAALEREADVMGEKAARGEASVVKANPSSGPLEAARRDTGQMKWSLSSGLPAMKGFPMQLKYANGAKPIQKKDPVVTHTGSVGLEPGTSGPPTGTVTVTEGEEYSKGTQKVPNTISLGYSGIYADKAHWLQFVNFELKALKGTDAPVYKTGDIRTTSGTKPFSTDKVTNWSVDTTSATDPYYEAGGINERTPGLGTKIFDKPGGSPMAPIFEDFVKKQAPSADKAIFTARFSTYLVIDNQVSYVVNYEAVTTYDPATKVASEPVYKTGAAGNAKGLPKALRAVLDKDFVGNPIK